MDSLRGFACLFVFLFHALGSSYGQDRLLYSGHGCWNTTQNLPLSFFFFYPLTLGWSGVALFFVLSGFLIHSGTLKAEAHNSAFQFLPYLRRRFWRIYPPYFVALLTFTLLAWSSHSEGAAALSKEFFWHFFLVHNFNAATFGAIDFPMWSVATEMQLYLLYVAFLWLRNRYSVLQAWGVTVAVSLTAIGIIQVCHGLRHGNPFVHWYEWCLGAYLAERWQKKQRLLQRWQTILLCSLLLLVSFSRWTVQANYPLAAFAAAGILEWALYDASPTPGRCQITLARLGVISYSVYLLHEPALQWWATYVGNHFSTPEQRLGVNTLALLPILLISLLFYRFLELPSHRYAQKARIIVK